MFSKLFSRRSRAPVAQKTQPLTYQLEQSPVQEWRSRWKHRKRRRGDDLENATSFTDDSLTDMSNLTPSTLHSTQNQTVSTLPTTVSTVSTQPGSSSTNADYYHYGDIIVYANEGGITPELELEWNEKILERLIHVFISNDIGCAFSLCMTAMREGEDPKASLVFTCPDSSVLQRAENTANATDWLMTFVRKRNLRVKFAIKEHAHPSAVEVDSWSTKMSFQGVCSMTIPNDLQSTCGLQIEVSARRGQPPRKCTIGGLILYENELYAWLVGHAFEQKSDRTLLNSIFAPAQKPSKSPVRSIRAKSPAMPSWKRLARQSMSSFRRGKVEKESTKLDDVSVTIVVEPQGRSISYDWALLKLDSLPTDTHKQLCLPNKIGKRPITGSQSLDKCLGTNVAIIGPGGTIVQGSMNRLSESVVTDSSTYCARKITLDRPLPRGCSGSWVVQDSYVIGHIVAVQKDLPCVYMLSMEKALQDIEKKLGSPVSIAVFDEGYTHSNNNSHADHGPPLVSEDVSAPQHRNRSPRPLLRHTNAIAPSIPDLYEHRPPKHVPPQIGSLGLSTEHMSSNLSTANHAPDSEASFLADLREQMRTAMCEDMFGRQYVPQQALNAIMSHGEVDEALMHFICRTCEITTAASRYFLEKCRRLLAIIIFASASPGVLKLLHDRNYYDSCLPLKPEIIHDLKQHYRKQTGGLEAIQSLQWRFLSPVFDETHSDSTTVRSLVEHLTLPDEMPVPITRDQAQPDLPKGEFGDLYKVKIHQDHHNLSSRRNPTFALRVIAARHKSRGQFEAEKQILKALTETPHEHIAEFKVSWMQNDSLYFLSDLATQNLRSYMDENIQPTLSKESALWLFSQLKGISDALRVIHSMDISGNDAAGITHSPVISLPRRVTWHHDLKPENILVFGHGPNSKLKISDFGLVEIRRLHTEALENSRTNHSGRALDRYAAPELLTRGHTGRAYDVWSLGCIYLEFITWIASGTQVLDRRRLLENNASELDHGCFWTVEGSRPLLHPATSAALQYLRRWSVSHAVFRSTTQLIEYMLRVHPEDRPWASTVANDLDVIAKQAALDLRDEDFYIQTGISVDGQTLSDWSQSSTRSVAKVERTRLTLEPEFHQALKTRPFEQYRGVDGSSGNLEFSSLLNIPKLNDWLQDTSPGLLWISGIPGCGKSALCKYLISQGSTTDLRQTYCSFFFNGNEKQETASTAICALLDQLLSQDPQIIHSILPRWKSMGHYRQRDTEALWQILLDLTKGFISRPVLCVIDALDECDYNDQEYLVDLLCKWQIGLDRDPGDLKASLKILVTSRPRDRLQALFQPVIDLWPEMHLRMEEADGRVQRSSVTVAESAVSGQAEAVELETVGTGCWCDGIDIRLASTVILDEGLINQCNRYTWTDCISMRTKQSLQPHRTCTQI